MIQLRRVIPYCQIGVWLAIIGLCLECALKMLDGTPALAWVPRAVTGTGYLEDSRLRVAQALDEYRGSRVATREYLAVLVGISEVREGVELSALAQGLGPRWRLLGLGGAGFGIGSVQKYANLLIESELRPDVVVLGMGFSQLVDYRPRANAAPPNLLEKLKGGDIRSAAVELRNSMWTYSRREDISVSVEFAVLELHAKLLNAFGVALPEVDARKRGPWREMIKTDWPEHFSAATLKAQEEDYERHGLFDLARYKDSPVALSALMGMIEQFQRRGAKVVLLLMPQHSTLNRRIPSEALDILRRRLQGSFPDNEPPILDYREVIDDSGFVDLPHLNRRGSREFSRELGIRLQEMLPDGPPLMAFYGNRQSAWQPGGTGR
jgi:hypothetical protein